MSERIVLFHKTFSIYRCFNGIPRRQTQSSDPVITRGLECDNVDKEKCSRSHLYFDCHKNQSVCIVKRVSVCQEKSFYFVGLNVFFSFSLRMEDFVDQSNLPQVYKLSPILPAYLTVFPHRPANRIITLIWVL